MRLRVEKRTGLPISKLVTVLGTTPASRASLRRDQPRPARAILTCSGVTEKSRNRLVLARHILSSDSSENPNESN